MDSSNILSLIQVYAKTSSIALQEITCLHHNLSIRLRMKKLSIYSLMEIEIHVMDLNSCISIYH